MWFLIPFVFDILGSLLDAAKPIILIVGLVVLAEVLGIPAIDMIIGTIQGVVSPA